MIEILCNGTVHYRRPERHPDLAELESLQAKGYCAAYSIRELEAEKSKNEENRNRNKR